MAGAEVYSLLHPLKLKNLYIIIYMISYGFSFAEFPSPHLQLVVSLPGSKTTNPYSISCEVGLIPSRPGFCSIRRFG